MASAKELQQMISLPTAADFDLKDARRDNRLAEILSKLSKSPDASLPKVFETKAALEGAYRFFSNDKFSWKDLERSCAEVTLKRSKICKDVIVIQDTTDIHYKIHHPDHIRKHMALVSSRTQGFSWHTSFVVSDTDIPVPLGVLASQPFVHKNHVDKHDEAKEFWLNQGGLYENESQRWYDILNESHNLMKENSCNAIHIMDCEADTFFFINHLVSQSARFVVRVSHKDRLVMDPKSAKTINRRGRKKKTETHEAPKDAMASKTSLTINNAMKDVDFTSEIEAMLGFRSPLSALKKQKSNPARMPRKTTLSLRACRVTLKRDNDYIPSYKPADTIVPKQLEIHLVEVVERNPPDGEAPVRWLLYTKEPIDTKEDIEKIVNYYRKRWLVEEFFKGIKTGCSLDERQLDSADATLKMLLVSSVLSTWMLALRTFVHEEIKLSWDVVLPETAFHLLRQSKTGKGLEESSSASDVYYVIARLGGHLKHNGPPGWQTLMKGLSELVSLVEGAKILAQFLGISEHLSDILAQKRTLNSVLANDL